MIILYQVLTTGTGPGAEGPPARPLMRYFVGRT
jgi:hypothetical protein